MQAAAARKETERVCLAGRNLKIKMGWRGHIGARGCHSKTLGGGNFGGCQREVPIGPKRPQLRER